MTITLVNRPLGFINLNAEANIRSLLVIGIDVVSLATSTNKAGYQVYAVDYFGDQDIKRVCRKSRSIIKQKAKESCGRLSIDFNYKTLLQLVKEISKEHKIDATLLASGLDDFPDVLIEINDLIPILGNNPDIIKRVRNKTTFFQELKHLGVPHPETAIVEDFGEAKSKSKHVGYPVVVKPSCSSGGMGVRKVRNTQELERAYKDASFFSEEVLIQEHISGTPASASLISSAKGIAILTLNEQLLGMQEVNQCEPFGYCGNIVPLPATKTVTDACEGIVKKIASYFSLVGSNGVDLVISKEGAPYVIEVNPRFQGTLECVERVLGINLVKAHAKACIQGTLPKALKEASVFCTRLILFASQCSVVPDLSVIDEARDIPLPGVVVEQGEPICSIVAEGTDRDSSLRKAKNIVKLIRSSLKPCS
jgi:hypothetical protein